MIKYRATLAGLRNSAAGWAFAVAMASSATGYAQSPDAASDAVAAESGSDAPSPQAAVQPVAEQGAIDDQSAPAEIIVTGTLIRDPNLQRSSPVAAVNSDEMELLQSNVAEEVLREMPAAVPSLGAQVNNGNPGQSFVDLRGLGVNRNIVLLDGVRVVPSNLAGVFDLNNVPLALVERVDVLTGGASTTYGADAVSGVVNFITKRDFEGAELSASEQITQKGDGNFMRADLTLGANFDDGRGNAVLSIGYQKSNAIYQGDRDFSRNSINSQTGLPEGSGTTVPGRFLLTGVGTLQIDANGALVPTYATFNFNPYNIFQTPFKRNNIYGSANYEVSDALELYAQALFSKNRVSTIVAPSGVFNSSVTIPVSNPYLPAAARAQFCANNDFNPNLEGVQTLTPAECAAAAIATSRSDPNYREFTTNLSRRTVETGTRDRDFTNTVFTYKAGARGPITDAIEFDIFGSHGQSELRQFDSGYVRLSRVRQALLATNPDSCFDKSNDCVPLNVFGPEGSITPEMSAFLTGDATTMILVRLTQGRAVASGEMGVTSPFSTRPVNFALGTEYRKYSAEQKVDSIVSIPGELGGFGGANDPINGGYDVKELFGELVVPIANDRPFFESLSLEAGIRHSSYSIDAPDSPTFSTTTYKLGGSWEPGAGIKFRGNYARAVRSPNIGELFTPAAVGLTNLNADPCAGQAPNNNANLRAICLAQGAPLSSIGSIANPTAGQANLTAGGSLDLKPETSNSYTIGVVWQPDFLPRFSMTLDYYNISIKDAITAPTPADLIALCFGSNPANPPANADSPHCTSIRRNPNHGGLDGNPAETGGLYAILSNSGRLKASGVDLAMNYGTDVGFGKLKFNFFGNYTHEAKFKATPISINRNCVGYYSINCGSPGSPVIGSIQPKFSWNQRTTLSMGDVDISLLWRYMHPVKYEPQQLEDEIAAALAKPDDCPDPTGADPGGCVTNPEFRKVGARHYFDLSGRVGLTDHVTVTATIQNLLDKQPPMLGNTIGTTTFNSGNTYPSSYDALGRRFAIGARVTF